MVTAMISEHFFCVCCKIFFFLLFSISLSYNNNKNEHVHYSGPVMASELGHKYWFLQPDFVSGHSPHSKTNLVL